MAEQTSLFGVDPALIEQALTAQKQKNAFDQAQLTPLQLPVYMGAMAGQGIGESLRDIGGAMMGKDLRDPRIIKAEKMKAVLKAVRDSGADLTNPSDYYSKIAQELNNQGLYEEAIQVADKSQSTGLEALKKNAEIEKLRAEAIAKLREKESNIQTLQRERENYIKTGRPDLAKESEAQIQKLNTGEYKVITQGSGDNQQEVLYDTVNNRVVKEFTPYSKKPMVQVDLGNKAGVVGLEAWKEVWVPMVKQFNDKNLAAQETYGKLEDIRKLVNSGNLNLGGLGNFKQEMSRYLFSAGLATKEQLSKMEDTDLLKAYTMNFILPKMKMLGGSDSNQELEKIESSFVNNRWTLGTMQRLLDISEKEIKRQLDLNKKLETHLANGGNPLAFNPVSGNIINNKEWFGSGSGPSAEGLKPISIDKPAEPSKPTQPALTPEMRAKIRAANPGRELTDEEIDAAYAKRKGK